MVVVISFKLFKNHSIKSTATIVCRVRNVAKSDDSAYHLTVAAKLIYHMLPSAKTKEILNFNYFLEERITVITYFIVLLFRIKNLT